MEKRLEAWLVALILVSPALGGERDAVQRYGELNKQLEREQRNYVSALYRSKTREEQQAAMRLKPRVSEYAPKFLAIAREDPASDAAMSAISWLIVNTPGSLEADEGFRILIGHHLDNKKLANLATFIADWPTDAAKELLRAAAEKSTVREVRGFARLTLGKLLAADARRLGAAGQSPRDEARAHLTSVAEDYAELKAADGKPYGEIARFALSRLEGRPQVGTDIGDRAPEIEGPDTNGKIMRLSESRGSVVVLVFWGHWCPWCHEVYEYGRSLKYVSGRRPFALLGVNSERDPEALRRTIAEQAITWRNWWLGKNPGILQDYPVSRYPTTLILDHQGVIRYRSFGTVDPISINRAASALQEERDQDASPPAEKSEPASLKKKTSAKRKS